MKSVRVVLKTEIFLFHTIDLSDEQYEEIKNMKSQEKFLLKEYISKISDAWDYDAGLEKACVTLDDLGVEITDCELTEVLLTDENNNEEEIV